MVGSDELEEVFTVQEVAKHLKVSDERVRQLVKQGDLIAFTIGGGQWKRRRITRSNLERFMKTMEVK